jgi:hypothetical protein
MAQNLTNVDEALRYDYRPTIREQLYMDFILLNKLTRNSEDVSGKRWQLVAHYGRTTGVGAGSETALPTAGNQGYKNPYDTVKYQRARIQVSGPSMKASRDEVGAIVQVLDSEIKGATQDFKRDLNRQLFGAGDSVLCLVNGDPGTGTTLTVDTPSSKYLHDGMVVDIVDATTGAVEDEDVTLSTITSSTAATASAALDSGIEDNSKVIRANSSDGAGTSYESDGLKSIVDDATYKTTLHNLSRSSYTWWKCSTHTNDDNSGTNRDLGTDLIQAALTAVETSGVGKTNLILSTPGVRDAYLKLLVADKRYVNTMTLDGGFTALTYNEIPWVADPDCTENTVYFVDLNHLFLMQMGEMDWADMDGAILSRVSDADAYEAFMYWYMGLATDAPKAHSFLRDVSNA